MENVNPLLKVTHSSLQGRIIEASGDIKNVEPPLEALMFSIYCMATLSLATNDCESHFGAAKDDLMAKYWFGCEQALFNCGFLRTKSLDCLTALFLYLVSICHFPRATPIVCRLLVSFVLILHSYVV